MRTAAHSRAVVSDDSGTPEQIVRRMQDVAPAGMHCLDPTTAEELGRLTTTLLSRLDRSDEFVRFCDVRHRSMRLSGAGELANSVILVTGGTGCIGSVLIRQLATIPGARVVSVSRGTTTPEQVSPGVDYRHVDIRSLEQVRAAFSDVRPDFVFHLAAIRDPGRAELEVRNTIETNIVGTQNVLLAASEVGVNRLIFASTGKAVRFFTGDVYAATKKICELLLAFSDRPVTSAVRFTHVVDNSLLLAKLQAWCDGGPMRLHSPEIAFYGQSALESSQLLMAASEQSGIYTLRNLGWPFELLDLALGIMQYRSAVAPIYFCGFERGYEEGMHPAMYDPATAGDVGPLANSLESYAATSSHDEQLNRFDLCRPAPDTYRDIVAPLVALCRHAASGDYLRSALQEASWALLESVVRAAPVLDQIRLGRLIEKTFTRTEFHPEYRRTSMVIAEAVRTTALAPV